MIQVRSHGLERNSGLRVHIFLIVLFCLYPFWNITCDAGENPFYSKQMAEESSFQPGEILVKFKQVVSSSSMESMLREYNATMIRSLYQSDVMVWNTTVGSELGLVERLNVDQRVDYAEPNYICKAFLTPNDSRFNRQWGHEKTNSQSGWNSTTGKSSTVIAILDSGIDENHPDLKSKIVAGYDFIDNDTNPRDTNGHGTHVAGIAAAVTNNGTGIAGMDWNARIMPIRILDQVGSGTISGVADGITWAYTHGANVLNLSLGASQYSQTLQNAVNRAHAAGSLVVAAMGNEDSSLPFYPAANKNVLAVAATNSSNFISDYSSYGSHCDISAPGGEMNYYHDPGGIYSTLPTYNVYLTTQFSYSRNYDYLQGTSQAAPMVSGLAALIWALQPSLSPDQVQMRIEETAVDRGSPGKDIFYGHGLMNAQAALKLVNPIIVPSFSPLLFDN